MRAISAYACTPFLGTFLWQRDPRLANISEGAMFLCPVVVRYGWDLDDECHLVVLQERYFYCLPSYDWSAMPCRFWCQAGNRGVCNAYSTRTSNAYQHIALHRMDHQRGMAKPESCRTGQSPDLTDWEDIAAAHRDTGPLRSYLFFPQCAYQAAAPGTIMFKPTTLMSTFRFVSNACNM